MRGELPLQPEDAAPWSRTRAQPVGRNAHGNATACRPPASPANRRGWERRFEHSIFIVDGEGNLIDDWPHLEELFDDERAAAAGRTRSRSARTTGSTSGSSTTSST
jgi:hypothetical protein